MASSFGKKRRGKRLAREYKPTHAELQKAMDIYFSKGGKVTKLQPEEIAPSFVNDHMAVDDFLMGS